MRAARVRRRSAPRSSACEPSALGVRLGVRSPWRAPGPSPWRRRSPLRPREPLRPRARSPLSRQAGWEPAAAAAVQTPEVEAEAEAVAEVAQPQAAAARRVAAVRRVAAAPAEVVAWAQDPVSESALPAAGSIVRARPSPGKAGQRRRGRALLRLRRSFFGAPTTQARASPLYRPPPIPPPVVRAAYRPSTLRVRGRGSNGPNGSFEVGR